MKFKYILGLVMTCIVSIVVAQSGATSAERLPDVDIASENFKILVDSLTTHSMTEQLYCVMFSAGKQAEELGDIRLAAIYYDKASGYALKIGDKKAMVESIIKSSEFNRKRNYAGTAIRQLTAAEEAVIGNAELVNLVNEAQVTNYEALGDIGNAYKYYRKVAEYKQNLAQKQVQTALSSESSSPVADIEDETSEKEHAVRQKPVLVFNVGDTAVFIIAGLIIVALIIILVMVIRAGRRRLVNNEKRLKDLFVSVPKQMIEDACLLRESTDSLITVKNRNGDEFKKMLDGVVGMIQKVSFNVCNMGFSGLVAHNKYTPELSICDADKLLKECKSYFVADMVLKNIVIDYKSTGLCDIECDADSVKFVIESFIYYSMQNTRSGGKISLWIETSGKSVKLAVENDGDKDKYIIAEMNNSDDLRCENLDTAWFDDSLLNVFNKIAKMNAARLFVEHKKMGGTISGLIFTMKK